MSSNSVGQEAAAAPQPPIDLAMRRRGRRTMLLLLAICLAPIVAAWLTFYFWRPAAGGNYGELLTPPQPIDLSQAQVLSPNAVEALHGKWVLLTVAGGACDGVCQRLLHDTHQVRTALAKEMPRVARAWLILDAAEPLVSQPPSTDPELVLLRAAPGMPALTPGQLYLRDPLGNLILRYPAELDGKRLLKDMNRLLKYSPLGTS